MRAMGKLKCEVEKAKHTLSSQQSTRIKIESFEDGNDFSETSLSSSREIACVASLTRGAPLRCHCSALCMPHRWSTRLREEE